MRKSEIQSKFLLMAGLSLLMAFLLSPFLHLVVSSIKPNEEIFAKTPSWWVRNPTMQGYKWALGPTGANLPVYLRNSFITSGATALLTMLLAATGGYALGRFQFHGWRLVVVLLMAAQLFQGPVVMVAWYRMAASLRLLNTRTILVLACGTMTVPVAVWLMAGFVRAIPREIEEAACVDGCSTLQLLARVVLPLARPGLVAITIYAFVTAWNDYQYGLILTSSDASKTVQVGMAELLTFFGQANWGGILASGVLATLPAVLLFALIQQHLVRGLTAGAIKG